MRLSHLTLIAMTWGLPFGALANDASPGLWQESGYREDESGKRTDCFNEGCFAGFPVVSGLNMTCASGPDLRGYARQHLAEFATLFRSHLHNCNDTADGGVKCDEGSMSQTISNPDATHVEFSVTTQGLGHASTRVWHYQRLGDDCSAANVLIRAPH
jgi:hypothetical protein